MAEENATAERVEKKLDQQIEKFQRQKKISIGAGAVLIVAVVIYYIFLASSVGPLSEPEGIADAGMGYLQDRAPEVRQQVTQQLQEQAEPMMNNVVDSTIERLPKVREQMEMNLQNTLDKQLVQIQENLNIYMEESLQNVDPRVEAIMERMAEVETPKQAEDEMYALLTQPFEAQEIRLELNTYAMALNYLAERLHYLRTADDLTGTEEAERDLIIVLRELSNRSGHPELGS